MVDPSDDERATAPTPHENGSKTGQAADASADTPADSMPPPPLPPRPAMTPDPPAEAGPLQAKATTAVSSVDIQTLTFPDGSRGTFSTPGVQDIATSESPTRSVRSTSAAHQRTTNASSGHVSPNIGAPGPGIYGPPTNNDVPVDAMSVMSFAPTMRPPGDLASLVAGDFHKKSRAWSLLRTQAANVQPFESTRTARVPYDLADFETEFEDVADEDEDADAGSDEVRLAHWKAKLKHYMILSSAGKPIWSRHGDLSLINSYMGVVQTIISFYEGERNPLQGFTAGNARFVIATEGPLYLVAISRLGESDTQLRDQLRALYMQILSTLTLPTLTNIFANRPSTDLRKPLQGTEGLLATLADSFTKGSPSALLGALECLRLRKSQRYAITNAFLKQRTDKLLYGLIVAGGKLVSVIRPRKHSLHPSDLQLIFNMLFESGGVKAGGGENWIPLCLPAFNNRGYLYMYVSFFDEADEDEQEKNQKKKKKKATKKPPSTQGSASAPASSAASSTTASTATSSSAAGSSQSGDESIAIILISADKESFFDLKEMREKVAQSLTKNGGLAIIRAAAAAGRPQVADIIRRPGTAVQISHFLYKSRANVQFAMSSLAPEFFGGGKGEQQKKQLEARRRLMTLYHQLHAAVHARHSHLKVLHCVGEDATSLAWITPTFEFYCVAGPNSSRSVVTQDANRIIQWAKREEERLFIIGGGVF